MPLMSAGNANPAKADDPADRPGRRNRELVKEIRAEWLDGKPDAAATTDLLATFRQASPEEASKSVVGLLNKGVAAQSCLGRDPDRVGRVADAAAGHRRRCTR